MTYSSRGFDWSFCSWLSIFHFLTLLLFCVSVSDLCPPDFLQSGLQPHAALLLFWSAWIDRMWQIIFIQLHLAGSSCVRRRAFDSLNWWWGVLWLCLSSIMDLSGNGVGMVLVQRLFVCLWGPDYAATEILNYFRKPESFAKADKLIYSVSVSLSSLQLLTCVSPNGC